MPFASFRQVFLVCFSFFPILMYLPNIYFKSQKKKKKECLEVFQKPRAKLLIQNVR